MYTFANKILKTNRCQIILGQYEDDFDAQNSLLIPSNTIPYPPQLTLKHVVFLVTLLAPNLAPINGKVMQSPLFPTGKNKFVSTIALWRKNYDLLKLSHINSLLLLSAQLLKSVTSNLLLTKFKTATQKARLCHLYQTTSLCCSNI